MINIVIEDGTGKSDSNAYVGVADAREYAEKRGVTLNADDEEVKKLIIKATDFLETFECDYVGNRTTDTQALSFPRTDAKVNGKDLATDEIPRQMIAAQCQCIIAQHNGFDLQPNYTNSDYVVEEKIGPITTKYANPVNTGILPTLTSVESLLKPLFGSCSSSYPLQTKRA